MEIDQAPRIKTVPDFIRSCMDIIRSKTTVRRQVWLDSLKPCHSGISTDILLFSDIDLSLIHHYWIHKRGLPHITFRNNYMSRMRALLPLPVAQPQDSVSSPVLTDPVSVRQAGSAELVEESPRRTRLARWRMRPVHVMTGSVDDFLILTIQDPTDAQGAMVYDSRPPLLPVLLQLCDLGPLSVRPTVASASVAVPPWEDGPTIGDVVSDVVVFPELGVASLVESRTDLEDELPTPDDSPSMDVVQPGEVALPEVCPVPWGGIDLELAKALLDVSVLPMMVTPIVEHVVESVGSPALYPEPPFPVLPVDEQVPVFAYLNEQVPELVPSPLREVAGSQVRDYSSSFLASPAGSVYGPITSPISPSLRCFVCMVHDRWIEVAWQTRVVVDDSRQTGGEPCSDTWSRAVSQVFSKRTDVLCIGDKVLLCLFVGV